MAIRWKNYSAGDAYDELITPKGHARTVARGAIRYLGSLSDEELRAEIRVTVLHEMAHHLGIDDERLHELGWD